MSTAEEIDAMSKAVVKNPAGRVSLDDIKAQIVEVYYVRAHECTLLDDAAIVEKLEGQSPHSWCPEEHPLYTMTLCFLVLKNGYISVGKTAAADPKNVNIELAKKFSYDDAIRQLWPVLAYEKRTDLMRADPTQP